MTAPSFKLLLDKYLLETLTEAEARTFFKMLESPDCRLQLEEQINKDLADRLYEEAEDFTRRDRIKNKLWRLKDQPEKEDARVIGLPRRYAFLRSRYAAAILILLLGGAGWWGYRTSRHNAEERTLVRQPLQTPVRPGGNKAILTLANGAVVILDSVHNGILAREGNSTVSKLKDGQLSYETGPSSGSAMAEARRIITYNTITTPQGGQYQVVLPDGTRAWLNAASSLRFPTSFAGKQRVVSLTGEGYFEVAKNAAMPFLVETAEMKVAVLGTSFDIMAYSDEETVRTTLVEGSVKVSNDNNQTLLIPGQQAQASFLNITGKGKPIKVVSNVDLEEVLAWKNERFQFHGTDIRTIMRQIGRWYDVKIVYEGNLSGIVLSGSVSRKEYAGQLLELLEATRRIRFVTDGKQIIVKPYK